MTKREALWKVSLGGCVSVCEGACVLAVSAPTSPYVCVCVYLADTLLDCFCNFSLEYAV